MQKETENTYKCMACVNEVCLGFCCAVDSGVTIPVEHCEQPDAGICLMVAESVCETYSCVKDAAWRFAELCVTVTGLFIDAVKQVLRMICRIVDEVNQRRVKAWSMLCRLRL